MYPPLKVLLLEDEPLIALELESLAVEMGLDPIVAGSVEDALAAVEANPVQLALLDYWIGSTTSEKVAVALQQRTIPYALCSGSDDDARSQAFTGVPVVRKPFDSRTVGAAISVLLGGTHQASRVLNS